MASETTLATGKSFSHEEKWEKLDFLKILFTLFNSALFGPFNTQGRSAPKHFPFLLNSRREWLAQKWVLVKIFNLRPTFSVSVAQFPRYSCLKEKKSYISALRTLAPFLRVPPYENRACLTNSVIPWPNGKFFNYGKWFLTFLTYI